MKISILGKKYDVPNVHFSSDLHLCHEKILEYSKRPFASLTEMNDTIINNINDRVGVDDYFFFLGDFCLGKGVEEASAHFRNRINCKNVFLIFGNHDKRRSERFCRLWTSCHDLLKITVDNQPIILCHYAMRVWQHSHHGAFHLFGHSHGSLEDLKTSLSFDVGVDCHDFKPLSFSDVCEKMKEKTFVPVDHHHESRP